MTPPGDAVAVLDARNVSKTYNGVRVLDSASLSLAAGEVHALVGMNGSGKSTFIKILAGVVKPDAGAVVTFPLGESAAAEHGTALAGAGPRVGRARLRRENRDVRLGFVHQDLGLVDSFSLVDNFALALGYETTRMGGVRRRKVAELTARGLSQVGLELPPSLEAGRLGAADRTLVAIGRALTLLADDPHPCLVVDEPTAALPEHEVQTVLDVLRDVARRGAAVLFVSHNLREVLSVSSRLTVLRDGHVVHQGSTEGASQQDVIDWMLGERVEAQLDAQVHGGRHTPPAPGRKREPALAIRGLVGRRARDVSLDVDEGEIVALTGLVGCGKSEIGRIVAGASPSRSGSIALDGAPFAPRSPHDAIAAGVGYVPAGRLQFGGILTFTAKENVSLPVLGRYARRGRVNGQAERRAALHLLHATDVRPLDPDHAFGSFSGGNQQKVVLSRALISEPRVLVIDEPTQGVDVGAIPVLYDRIRAAAAGGAAVVVITSSYDEAVALADRAVVLGRGRVRATLGVGELSTARLAAAANTIQPEGKR